MTPDKEKLYMRIAERVTNLIMQNAEAIERDFEGNLKIVEDPSKLILPIVIKAELSRLGDTTSHREFMTWEVKKKERIDAEVETFDPNQPDFFDGSTKDDDY